MSRCPRCAVPIEVRGGGAHHWMVCEDCGAVLRHDGAAWLVAGVRVFDALSQSDFTLYFTLLHDAALARSRKAHREAMKRRAAPIRAPEELERRWGWAEWDEAG